MHRLHTAPRQPAIHTDDHGNVILIHPTMPICPTPVSSSGSFSICHSSILGHSQGLPNPCSYQTLLGPLTAWQHPLPSTHLSPSLLFPSLCICFYFFPFLAFSPSLLSLFPQCQVGPSVFSYSCPLSTGSPVSQITSSRCWSLFLSVSLSVSFLFVFLHLVHLPCGSECPLGSG